jgi:hypothetical protein
MHDLAVQVHRLRNQFSEDAHYSYDAQKCNHIVEQIQSLAAGIANDREGNEVITEMEYKNEHKV